MTKLSPAASLALLLAACASDLPKATDIERMRVLGTKITVIGDEERATPAPGERVHLSFVTVFPDLDGTTEESELMIVSCTAPDRFTGGLPICQELIDLAESDQASEVDQGSVLAQARKLDCRDIPMRRQTFGGVTVACVSGPPEIDLPIPADFAAESAMFLGVLCEKGRAYFDPTSTELFGCDDNDGETIGLHGTYPVQLKPEDVNHNPDISKLSIEMAPFIQWHPIDGTRLTEPGVLVEDDCRELAEDIDNDGVLEPNGDDKPGPLLKANPFAPAAEVGKHELTLRYPARERERVDGEYEPLEISIHTTFGEMERQFTVWTHESETVWAKLGDVPIDTEPPWLEEGIAWDPDNNHPPNGQLVRFFVTVRDQRGGFDMSTYAACVR